MEILYGYPSHELFEEAEAGKALLGDDVFIVRARKNCKMEWTMWGRDETYEEVRKCQIGITLMIFIK